MMRGVMHRAMPHFVVHNYGFTVRGRNTLARLNGLHARLQIGQLLMLLCGSAHQLCRRRFSSGFQSFQSAVEQCRVGLLFGEVGRQGQAHQYVVQRVHILHYAQLRVQGGRRRLCLL